MNIHRYKYDYPICKESKGEKRIAKFIFYIRESKFRRLGNLRFDFIYQNKIDEILETERLNTKY